MIIGYATIKLWEARFWHFVECCSFYSVKGWSLVYVTAATRLGDSVYCGNGHGSQCYSVYYRKVTKSL